MPTGLGDGMTPDIANLTIEHHTTLRSYLSMSLSLLTVSYNQLIVLISQALVKGWQIE